ncbi:MAG TPA: ABC transporter permease [Gemmatimonadaceae bacterium]|nr:ABC transporter permease [Gemmatimonadaceae bacterium]
MRRVFRIPFSRSRVEREIDDELAFHIQTRVDQLVRGGLSAEAARTEALRQFGALDDVREQMLILDRQREATVRRAHMFDELRQDLSYGVRTLRRNLGFTALVVGGLALGIGANAAIYSLIDAVLLRKLPVVQPDRLVVFGDPARVTSLSDGTPNTDLLSYPVYHDVRARDAVFTDVLATGRADQMDVRFDSTSSAAEHPRARFVSANYFAVLGVRAERGRTFDAAVDESHGVLPEVVISDEFWKSRFNGDPSVVGRPITINDVRLTIIGIAAPGFTGEVVGNETNLWLPLSTHDAIMTHRRFMDDRGVSWLLLIGRLKPGITLAQARAALIPMVKADLIAHANANDAVAIGDPSEPWVVESAARGLSRVRADFSAPLLTLMVGVALLLGIVCVNVANLLLARGIARRREMSLRLAIGANRGRIVRQLLTESVLLALVSGAAALVVAWWGSRGLVMLASQGSTISLALGPNAAELAFTLGLSVASVLAFGLVPALRASRVDLATTMRATSRSVSQGRRFGTLLITAQVALSLVLLTGAAMLARSLSRLQATDIGVDRDHLIVADFDVQRPGYTPERLANVVHALRDAAARVPGVAAVTYSENGLFTGTESATSIEIPGFTARTSDDSSIAYDRVGVGFARSIGARVLAGRDIDASDEGRPGRTALVNATFAKFYFPDKQAVGQYLHIGDTASIRIVGVIGDVHEHSLDAPQGYQARRVFFPYLVTPDSTLGTPESLRLLVRTHGDPAALVEPLRAALAPVDRALPLYHVRPLAALVRVSIREERLVAQIASGLAVLALLLAAIGMYGVMNYTIARRTGEIGVRVAIGARQSDIARMVVLDALRPVAVGVVAGLPLTVLAMRALQSKLNGVTPSDWESASFAVLVLAASAIVAALAPARRATRIDPMTALREE